MLGPEGAALPLGPEVAAARRRLPLRDEPPPALLVAAHPTDRQGGRRGGRDKKRVYPHLLRHSVAMTLLERGMPIDHIQKSLGHSKLETTLAYAEFTTEMIKESYRRALTE